MPEYRRFISYIYEYRSGRKGKNCGYVKVEIRNGVCRLRLHMQEPGRLADALKVHAFVRAGGAGEELRGIPLGSAAPVNGVLDFQVSTPAGAVNGTEYSVDDVRGIWLRGEQQENYITVWDDEPVAVERFRPLAAEDGEDAQPDALSAADAGETADTAPDVSGSVQPAAEAAADAGLTPDVSRAAQPGVASEADAGGATPDVSKAAQPGAASEADAGGATPDVNGTAKPGVLSTADAGGAMPNVGGTAKPGADMGSGIVESASAAAAEREPAGSPGVQPAGLPGMQPAEIPGVQSAETSAAAASGSLWSRWDHFLRHYPQIRPFADDEIIQCIAIAPKDISYLPRAEWQFARNTFVRQAHMRYHHLMLGCHASGRFVLAVPGTDDAQERHMARMHGFLYYKEADAERIRDGEVCAAEGERPMQPRGYWYCFLEEKWPR